MTDVIWGSTNKPVTSERLARLIEAEFNEHGVLYVGYPVLAGAEGVSSVDALWVSPQHGVVIFHLIEGADATGFEVVQDDYANKLETRLRAHNDLMQGRKLLAEPVVVTFAPLAGSRTGAPNSDYRIASDDASIRAIIHEITWSRPDLYERAHSVIQSISSIRSGRRKRSTARPDSRGAILKRLEDSIANLDSLQSRAVIETVEGVQRIRGLAGSGKTIILALKAAYLHVQHPEWKIAVTFNTRSLKDQFRKFIQNFVFEQTKDQPDWDKIQIINAWGAPGSVNRSGVYYQYCQANGIEFWDFQRAKDKFSTQTAFSGVVNLALTAASGEKKIFDAILVDEAQDFDPNFLRLCFASLGENKRLVYAYDELQSLTESSLPPPDELFGQNANGQPNVVFDEPVKGRPSQDIILEKCYRNSRPVLATAHALGFGIYRDVDIKTETGLIQMFDRAELWRDVGYAVKAGSLEDGHQVVLSRTPESSPQFLEAPSQVDRLIEFVEFENTAQQAQWLADQIEKNLGSDELHHDDIIVINPDPISTVKQVAIPRRLLFEKGIQSHVAGVDTSSDVFFRGDQESVAFTGIFRAKGNEAGMVYVINAQDCYGGPYNAGKVRNQLFTAITRSKAWVKVLGVGPNMARLKAEYERVESQNYELNFIYPPAEVRKKLKVVNRDRSALEQKTIKGAATNLNRLISDIGAGRVLIEDLPADDIAALRSLLNNGAGGRDA
ncbi:ATP-binding domain-containing protein [Pseudomonas sp.]|uniref:DEAD/DEAH box helicase n=1 Tax=Pseudomonas sp. TaxID=306 RepID=UPI0026034080|nr:ATP-binding domain-containing protein [Pseudomonas sp.]